MSAQWPDGPVSTDDAEETASGDASTEPGTQQSESAQEGREPEAHPGESAQAQPEQPAAQPEQPAAQPEQDGAPDAEQDGAPGAEADARADSPAEPAQPVAEASADAGEEEDGEFESGADDQDDDAPMYSTERTPEPVSAEPASPPNEPAPEPAGPAPEPATAPAVEASDGNGAAAEEDGEAPEEEEDTGPKITPVEGSEWYILQTYSGFENRVKKTIEEKLRVAALEHLVEEVFVPGEDVTRVKNGRKRTMHVIYFPGYVLIKMKLTDDLWHLLMDIPRVAGFVGGNNRDPQPLGEEELSHIRSQMSEGYRQATLKEEFEIGQQVIVIDGPFANFSGKIDEVNAEKSKLRVLISILGRSTPVELDFDKVKAHPDAG